MLLTFTTNAATWNQWCSDLGVDDVYYSLDYYDLWRREQPGEPVGIRFDGRFGTVLYPVLRVPLDALPGGEGLHDLRTVYDFGGPLALGADQARLLDEFDQAFVYIKESWNVVTEFGRLHPFRYGPDTLPRGASQRKPGYIVDLAAGYDSIQDAYHDSFARNVRKAERNDLGVAVEERPDEALQARFVELYLDTMSKVGADDFYFFKPGTLREMMDLDQMRLAYVHHDGRPIAMALFLTSANDDFYYLGCSDRDSLDLRPNNLLFDRIIRDGLDRGRRYLHLGGGPGGVRRFKSQIANAKVPYHQLRRIHRPADYRRLCANVGVEPAGPHDMLPAYRPCLLELNEAGCLVAA